MSKHELEHLHAEVEHLKEQLAEARQENERWAIEAKEAWSRGHSYGYAAYNGADAKGYERGYDACTADVVACLRAVPSKYTRLSSATNFIADDIAAGAHVGAAAPILPKDQPHNYVEGDRGICVYYRCHCHRGAPIHSAAAPTEEKNDG